MFPTGSLYERPLNFEEALKEHINYVSELRMNGINVIEVGEILRSLEREKLETIASESLTYESEKKELLEEKEDVIKNSSLESLIQMILLRPTHKIKDSDEGNTKYSSNLELNPLYNLMFMRDQQITTEKGIVIGRMNSSQRRLETTITKLIFDKLGMNIVYEVNGSARLEGGDYMPLGDYALLGIGLRTNMEAARQLMENDVFGKNEVALVIDEKRSQDEMHLDTYLNFPAEDKAIMLENRLDYSSPDVLVYMKEDGRYILKGKTKLDKYLISKGCKLIPITKEEQLNYGVNFLTVANNKVIGVKNVSSDYLKKMEKNGIDFVALDFTNLTAAYGGPHCLTQAVSRETEKIILSVSKKLSADLYNKNAYNNGR